MNHLIGSHKICSLYRKLRREKGFPVDSFEQSLYREDL